MKIIYMIVGIVSLILGIVGVVLPILPTTPFLLLASFCFTKGSNRFHQWLIGTKLYKKHLESVVKDRSMTFKNKCGIVTFASCMLILAFIFANHFHLRMFIIFLMLYKYYYFIFKIQTIKEQVDDK